MLWLALSSACEGPSWVVARPLPGTACAVDEGPPWGSACANGRDDDCDGLVDDRDPSCARGGSVQLAGWELERPALPLRLLNDLWVGADSTAWAVGGYGLTMHWDGARWAQVYSGSEADLRGVWGAAADDVWAVGSEGTALRWNGRAWHASETGVEPGLNFNGVWGLATDAVWTWGGGVYSTPEPALLRFDGRAWQRAAAPDDALRAVAGTAPEDLFALGQDSLYRWDGARWQTLVPDLPCGDYVMSVAEDLWPGAAGEAWVACTRDQAWRWRGQGLEPAPYVAGAGVSALWGPDPGELWAVGAGSATVQHWREASEWQDATFAPVRWLRRVAGSQAAGLALAFGPEAMVRWDLGSGDGQALTEEDDNLNLMGLFALSPTVAFAVGWDGVVLRRDAAGWQRLESGTDAILRGVWARSEDEVWIAGDHLVLRWDGTRFERHAVAAFQGGIWGSASDDVWVSGQGGDLLRWDGQAWQRYPDPGGEGQPVYGIWGCRADEVWFVGGRLAVRWDGAGLQRHAVPGEGALWSLHGSACDQVWAAGLRQVSRWDGVAWRDETPCVSCNHSAVWVAGPDEVWVAGSIPRLMRWDGGGWTTPPMPAAYDLWAIHGPPGGPPWAAGLGYLYRLVAP